MTSRRHRRDVWEKDPGSERSEVEAVNAERIELLTRKLSNDAFTSDDQARLDSLTAKMQELAPRITEKDWGQLKQLERRLDKREVVLDHYASSGGVK